MKIYALQSINNIRFNYLYRDYSNYKNYGSVVLDNPNNFSLKEIEKLIRDKLIDGEYLDAHKSGLPTLFFEITTSDDHELHEFQSLELTNDLDISMTIEDFLERLL